MSTQVSGRDVERIVRDVIAASAVKVTLLRTEALPDDGWRVTLKDIGDRLFSVDLPAAPAAAIRQALQVWIDHLTTVR